MIGIFIPLDALAIPLVKVGAPANSFATLPPKSFRTKLDTFPPTFLTLSTFELTFPAISFPLVTILDLATLLTMSFPLVVTFVATSFPLVAILLATFLPLSTIYFHLVIAAVVVLVTAFVVA